MRFPILSRARPLCKPTCLKVFVEESHRIKYTQLVELWLQWFANNHVEIIPNLRLKSRGGDALKIIEASRRSGHHGYDAQGNKGLKGRHEGISYHNLPNIVSILVCPIKTFKKHTQMGEETAAHAIFLCAKFTTRGVSSYHHTCLGKP